MLSFRRTLVAAAAFASWSCGSTQPPDATPEVAAIVVNPSSSTLALNAQLPLQALVQNEAGELVPDASVTWTVENSTVASVSPAGVVTALALGTTQVAASARGKSGIATVTVQKTPVASVVVVPNRVSAGIGSTTKLTATAYDAGQNLLADRGMVWTTSNASVATVDGAGLVTAKGKGTATITATAEGKSGTSEFTISPGSVSRVSVTPNSLSMVAGDRQHLTAAAADASGTLLSGTPVVWASDNLQVATVSGGEVTAVGSGSASITATVDGVSGAAAVSVAKVPVSTVSVAPTTLTVGSKAQLAATVTDARGNVVTDRAVTWSMPANSFASITASGEVTGLAAGSATATATSEGKSGSAAVTVAAAPAASVTVAPGTLSLTVAQTGPLAATVKDANGNVLTGRAVNWSTSNALVATVSQAGVVTGLLPGTATITATSGNASGTATVTVSPIPVGSVSVSPSSRSIVQNASTTLTATVKDANGNTLNGQAITWTTSDGNVARPSATSGPSIDVTGGVSGTATITASSGGQSGTSSITVTNGTVASVVVTLQSTTIKKNATTTATAVVLDGQGRRLQGRTVTWTASGAATIAPASSTTSTGDASAATSIVTAKNVSSTQTSTITARESVSGRQDAVTLTVTP
jgi:trimeric autotransporter adhesin